MIHDLTNDERCLAELMREISEKCYNAGWMKNTEYILWNAINKGPRGFGHGKITQADIEGMKTFSLKTNKWIVFDHEQEEVAIPLDVWESRFNEHIRNDPDRLR